MDKTQRSTDVALRKSPSVSAKVYPEGTVMEGNDGNNWTITVDSNGVHRWAKINSYKAPTPKKQMPKEDVVEEVSEVTEVRAPIVSSNQLQPDFIKKFVSENADNLARLEKTNKPLLIAIEDTLNFLSKRFGNGEENADSIINKVLPIVIEEKEVVKEEVQDIIEKGTEAVSMLEEIDKTLDDLIEERDSLIESLEYAEGDDLIEIQNEIEILNLQISKITKWQLK